MIKLIPVDKNCEKNAKELYFSAFPKEERAPFSMLMKKYERKKADFYAAFDGDVFVGFIYGISDEKTVYVFYLAVAPEVRGKGYGGAILERAGEIYENKITLLSIERTDEECDNLEQRLKRREFYGKNGFTEAGFTAREGKMVYQVLCRGNTEDLSADRLEEMYNKLFSAYLGRLVFNIRCKKR